jgi:hypothetical protein
MGWERSPPRAPSAQCRSAGQNPDQVQLNKALLGFLTHSGYAQGGNGYEGIAFLINQFREIELADPSDRQHGVDLQALAARCATEYEQYKCGKRSAGSLDIRKIPGVNRPVFKDKPVNYDPREVWVPDLFTRPARFRPTS